MVPSYMYRIKAPTTKDVLVVPKHIAELAAKLWAACAEYEHAARLASTAVANARAK